MEHYIDLLERKPRSVFNAKPVKEHVKKELLDWGQKLPGGAKDLVKLLRLCVDHGADKILQIKHQLPLKATPTIDLIRSLLDVKTKVPADKTIVDNFKVAQVDLGMYDRQYGVLQ